MPCTGLGIFQQMVKAQGRRVQTHPGKNECAVTPAPEDPQPVPALVWAAVLASQEQQVDSSTLPTLTLSLPPPRWLSYLLLFILDLVICLVTCLGLARRSKCLLAS